MNIWKNQPQIKPINKIAIPEPEFFKLKNSIPIYFFKSDENILKIKIVFNAGNFFQKLPLQAFFTNKILGEGSKNYSSKKIAEVFDFYGAKLNFISDDDHASVTMLTAKKNLISLLPVFADILHNPLFPEKEFLTQREIALQNFNISNEKVATLARKAFMEALFGNSNFYGYNVKGEDFGKLDSENLKSFYNNFYTTNNCFIILSGNFQNSDLEQIQSHLGKDIKTSCKSEKPNFDIISAGTKKMHLPKKEALQTGIRIGKTLFNRTHKDDIGFRVLNMILGGYFGSRLMTNIREDKGYTYGIYSSLTSLQHSGYFSVITEVGTPVYKNALNEIYKEILKIQEQKVGEEELTLVKNYILGNLLRNIDGQFNYSSLFENFIVYGLGTKYLENYINEVQNISPERILLLAQNYLNTDSLFEITAG